MRSKGRDSNLQKKVSHTYTLRLYYNQISILKKKKKKLLKKVLRLRNFKIDTTSIPLLTLIHMAFRLTVHDLFNDHKILLQHIIVAKDKPQ